MNLPLQAVNVAHEHCIVPLGLRDLSLDARVRLWALEYCQHLMMPEPEVVKGHDIMKCLQIHVARIPERGSCQIFVHPGDERLGVSAISLEAKRFS